MPQCCGVKMPICQQCCNFGTVASGRARLINVCIFVASISQSHAAQYLGSDEDLENENSASVGSLASTEDVASEVDTSGSAFHEIGLQRQTAAAAEASRKQIASPTPSNHDVVGGDHASWSSPVRVVPRKSNQVTFVEQSERPMEHQKAAAVGTGQHAALEMDESEVAPRVLQPHLLFGAAKDQRIHGELTAQGSEQGLLASTNTDLAADATPYDPSSASMSAMVSRFPAVVQVPPQQKVVSTTMEPPIEESSVRRSIKYRDISSTVHLGVMVITGIIVIAILLMCCFWVGCLSMQRRSREINMAGFKSIGPQQQMRRQRERQRARAGLPLQSETGVKRSRRSKGEGSSSGGQLDADFIAATNLRNEILAEVFTTLTNSEKLLLYSLYKQASCGDVEGERPGMFDLVNQAKWDAWAEVQGVSMEEAKQRYVALVDERAEGWRDWVDKDAPPPAAADKAEEGGDAAAAAAPPGAKGADSD
eukprot:TRINITY_DN38039_c0_g1_i1.p1 TRINITY_DN38039_c0_g1~~TRINITY_DN38039_c0_g1_i1.p1  ORF type:complete len:479 (-),score=95.79 TRINITY_DN38039_c0_g1_i1:90-1526(-)